MFEILSASFLMRSELHECNNSRKHLQDFSDDELSVQLHIMFRIPISNDAYP